jgi:hypothetical protein
MSVMHATAQPWRRGIFLSAVISWGTRKLIFGGFPLTNLLANSKFHHCVARDVPGSRKGQSTDFQLPVVATSYCKS